LFQYLRKFGLEAGLFWLLVAASGWAMAHGAMPKTCRGLAQLEIIALAWLTVRLVLAEDGFKAHAGWQTRPVWPSHLRMAQFAAVGVLLGGPLGLRAILLHHWLNPSGSDWATVCKTTWLPQFAGWLGFGLTLVGIATLSHEPPPSGGSQVATGAGLAIVAALGFGLFFVGIDAGSDESATWAVLVARAVGVSLAVGAAAVTSKALRPERSLVPMLAAIGLVDTGANLLVATATTQGATGIVAVLSSLYPVVTVVLAWLVLGERLNAAKRIGGAIAVAGAAFVAAG